MKTRLNLFCLSFLLLLTLSGCCIHQWPEQDEVPCAMTLHLKFNPDFYVWEHVYDAERGRVTEANPDKAVHPEHPGTTDLYDNTQRSGYIRHVVRIYPTGESFYYIKEIEVFNETAGLYDCDIPISIAPGKYDIVVWSDLYEAGKSFYDATDFLSVNLTTPHWANTDFRDAFRGVTTVDAEVEANLEATVDMHRPMAKFEFISTGLKEFMNREAARTFDSRVSLSTYKVVFTYTNFMPCSYSVIDDRLVDSRTGVQFESAIIQISDDEVSLGFDYVMINSTSLERASQGVTVMVTIYDEQGEQTANSVPITVPLRRDDHTVIRSAFLSENAKGGVAIDPAYDGDHNVFL